MSTPPAPTPGAASPRTSRSSTGDPLTATTRRGMSAEPQEVTPPAGLFLVAYRHGDAGRLRRGQAPPGSSVGDQAHVGGGARTWPRHRQASAGRAGSGRDPQRRSAAHLETSATLSKPSRLPARLATSRWRRSTTSRSPHHWFEKRLWTRSADPDNLRSVTFLVRRRVRRRRALSALPAPRRRRRADCCSTAARARCRAQARWASTPPTSAGCAHPPPRRPFRRPALADPRRAVCPAEQRPLDPGPAGHRGARPANLRGAVPGRGRRRAAVRDAVRRIRGARAAGLRPGADHGLPGPPHAGHRAAWLPDRVRGSAHRLLGRHRMDRDAPGARPTAPTCSCANATSSTYGCPAISTTRR